MKKVLVAGASGYLGKYLLSELEKQGFEPVALVRNPQKIQSIFSGRTLEAEVTNPSTIHGIYEGMDMVISTVGITRQKDNLTYMDVDFQANINILEEAKRSRVSKFVYISVLRGDQLKHLKMVEAKEKFVDALKSSGIKFQVIRPNGFFSDMEEILEMAKKGTVYLFGKGKFRGNPIHGEDLARFIVNNLENEDQEFEIGGPDILEQNEIAELAFEALGQKSKISHIPDWIRRWILGITRFFTGEKKYGPIEFFMTVMAMDMIAPTFGKLRLSDYFKELSEIGKQNT